MLFGDSSSLASGIMMAGSSAVVLYTISILFNTIIQSVYKMMIPVLHSGIAIVIDVIVLFILLRFTNMGVYALVIGNLLLPLIVIVLNWIVLKRDLALRLNLRRAVIIPAISSLLMGIVILFLYRGLMILVKSNTISTLISILMGIIVFFFCLVLLRGITEDELYGVPQGKILVRILKKLHLLR